MFSWRKYPDQINLELIRVVLSNAKKEGHEKRLTGSERAGWTLSRTGLVWSRKNSRKLLRTNLDRKREQSRVGSIDEQRWRRERARVTATATWEKWLAGNSAVTQREASEVFPLATVNRLTPKRRLTTRLCSAKMFRSWHETPIAVSNFQQATSDDRGPLASCARD